MVRHLQYIPADCTGCGGLELSGLAKPPQAGRFGETPTKSEFIQSFRARYAMSLHLGFGPFMAI
jgi:hypothetical protein